jgi:hypothetical protein
VATKGNNHGGFFIAPALLEEWFSAMVNRSAVSETCLALGNIGPGHRTGQLQSPRIDWGPGNVVPENAKRSKIGPQ